MADLFDVVVARKLSGGGGGGGSITVEPLSVTENDTYTAPTGKAYSPVTVNVSGGGSSDFSTVQMTVNGSGSYPMRGAFVAESWGKGGPATTIGTYYSDDYGYPGSFSVVMYKGTAVVEFDEQATITATGNATVDWKYVTITGDCTITIS